MKVAHQGIPVAELPGGGRAPGFGFPFPQGGQPDDLPPAVVGSIPQQAPQPQQQEPMTLDRWFVDTFLGGRR